MRERPILFSAPMVRAILAGLKSQTRRVVKPVQPRADGMWPAGRDPVPDCPYGQPGDRLWVREGFKPIASGEVKDGYGEVRYGFAYKADAATRWAERPTIIHDLTGQPATGLMQFQERPWKSPIHMPRRASRITLEVTGVRVERLQDVSEDDAIAEGIERDSEGRWTDYENTGFGGYFDHPLHGARLSYASLWDSINGRGGWDANPWVWVVEFRRVQP